MWIEDAVESLFHFCARFPALFICATDNRVLGRVSFTEAILLNTVRVVSSNNLKVFKALLSLLLLSSSLMSIAYVFVSIRYFYHSLRHPLECRPIVLSVGTKERDRLGSLYACTMMDAQDVFILLLLQTAANRSDVCCHAFSVQPSSRADLPDALAG